MVYLDFCLVFLRVHFSLHICSFLHLALTVHCRGFQEHGAKAKRSPFHLLLKQISNAYICSRCEETSSNTKVSHEKMTRASFPPFRYQCLFQKPPVLSRRYLCRIQICKGENRSSSCRCEKKNCNYLRWWLLTKLIMLNIFQCIYTSHHCVTCQLYPNKTKKNSQGKVWMLTIKKENVVVKLPLR